MPKYSVLVQKLIDMITAEASLDLYQLCQQKYLSVEAKNQDVIIKTIYGWMLHLGAISGQIGWDGSPDGVRHRTPYDANNNDIENNK